MDTIAEIRERWAEIEEWNRGRSLHTFATSQQFACYLAKCYAEDVIYLLQQLRAGKVNNAYERDLPNQV